MKRIHLSVKGRVQGVSFRAYTRIEATRLGLAGYAKNLSDGSVEIVAEGKESLLRKLAAWAEDGSPAARVDEVAENFSKAAGEFADFDIRY